MTLDRPLAGLRVVDLIDGPLAPITRYLAELGARVDRHVATRARPPISSPMPARSCTPGRSMTRRSPPPTSSSRRPPRSTMTGSPPRTPRSC
ncbi:hypothetical protein [Sphingopyxis sp. KK2]|uniref:hypothetical protein n=1 Tax=Sphingopyxis sp. KK2 TaxID=1855727 RepID=UPI00097E66D8|nr:hypothetical protein [Sphingopyxis sp. KK2]